jgi:hypothetical protein
MGSEWKKRGTMRGLDAMKEEAMEIWSWRDSVYIGDSLTDGHGFG